MIGLKRDLGLRPWSQTSPRPRSQTDADIRDVEIRLYILATFFAF